MGWEYNDDGDCGGRLFPIASSSLNLGITHTLPANCPVRRAENIFREPPGACFQAQNGGGGELRVLTRLKNYSAESKWEIVSWPEEKMQLLRCCYITVNFAISTCTISPQKKTMIFVLLSSFNSRETRHIRWTMLTEFRDVAVTKSTVFSGKIDYFKDVEIRQ